MIQFIYLYVFVNIYLGYCCECLGYYYLFSCILLIFFFFDYVLFFLFFLGSLVRLEVSTQGGGK